MASHPYTAAVILSAGSGSRMGSSLPKQWISICSKPMLCHSIEAFNSCPEIDAVTVVCRAGDEEKTRALCDSMSMKKVYCIVCGGETRQQSVEHALTVLPSETQYIAIHDAARPLITVSDITQVCRAAYTCGAAAAMLDICDTVKKVNHNGFITDTLNRDELRAASTPQVFDASEYCRACRQAEAQGFAVTDDCMLFEMLGLPVKAVKCDPSNKKMTYPSDLLFAESVLKTENSETKNEADMRIGHGYDVHKLVCGRPLILGGVTVPYEKGLLGHSDADVLVHAIADAVLGAAGLPDIGHLFPDSDEKYRGAYSIDLLKDALHRVYALGYRISNVDATIIAQAPKLSPYLEEMKQKISAAMDVTADKVGIKATTEEGLGFTGTGAGIAVHAVCLLKRSASNT